MTGQIQLKKNGKVLIQRIDFPHTVIGYTTLNRKTKRFQTSTASFRRKMAWIRTAILYNEKIKLGVCYMQYKVNDLKSEFSVLDNLNLWEAGDEKVFKWKLKILRDVALRMIEEIDALENVRSVNIRRGINLHDEMRMFEVHLVQSALERTGGHQTRAAQLLGINLTTLHNKLKRLNISPENIVNAPVLHEDIDYSSGSAKEN